MKTPSREVFVLVRATVPHQIPDETFVKGIIGTLEMEFYLGSGEPGNEFDRHVEFHEGRVVTEA